MQFILEDNEHGFGWPVTLKDPDGNTNADPIHGYSSDIGALIDPDTGQAVSGRLATAVVRISSLAAQGLGIPQSIADTARKPWVVTFNDINGNAYTFTVQRSDPDRALGIVLLTLEFYQDA